MADMAEGMQNPPNFSSSHKETEMEISEVELDEENVRRLLAEEEQNEHERGVEEDLHDRDDLQQSKTETSSSGAALIFIGGLGSKTTEDDLKTYFAQYGTPTSIELAKKMTKSGERKSRGFGFVSMATVAETETVLKKENHVIDEKLLTVRISEPPDASERKLRLCVSQLDVENTTEDTLRAHFSQFGPITSCLLSKEQIDGKIISRGIAFVTMATEGATQAVFAKNDEGHQIIDGKLAQVRRISGDTEHFDRLRKLWVGGLDKEKTTESDLTEYFSTFGVVQSSVIVRDPPETEGETGKSKGYGFIHMSSVVDISAILKHDGPHVIHDNDLVFNRMRLSKNHLVTELHLIKQIIVSDLRETGLTIDVLRAYFNKHGKVRQVTINAQEGTATVAFHSNGDVEKLAQMRDHFIKKHWVTVIRADPQDKPITKPSGYKKKEEQRPKRRHRSQQRDYLADSRKSSRREQSSAIVGRSLSFGSEGGGYGPGGQDFYGGMPSNYGPVTGMGQNFHGGGSGRRGRGSGGWVYVENLYDDPNMNSRQQGRKGKGFKGRGQGYGSGHGYGSGYSNAGSEQGGGYGGDWGMGNYSNTGGGWSY